jgi:hypothetical protein
MVIVVVVVVVVNNNFPNFLVEAADLAARERKGVWTRFQKIELYPLNPLNNLERDISSNFHSNLTRQSC